MQVGKKGIKVGYSGQPIVKTVEVLEQYLLEGKIEGGNYDNVHILRNN